MYHTHSALDVLHNLPTKLKRSIHHRGLFGTIDLAWRKLGTYFADRLVPSRYRDLCIDREFDARFGVRTQGTIAPNELRTESDSCVFANEYAPSRPGEFFRLLGRIKVRYEDFIFVDLGSGKGRVLLMASELSFRRIVGVEFDSELHRVAEENIHNYQSPTGKCGNFELLHLDAADYPIPDEKTIFYFYNPFQEEVLAKVLANIRRSLAEHPREIYIIYCNAVHRDVVSRYGFATVEASRQHAIYTGAAAAESKE